jgi:hypothetical protein
MMDLANLEDELRNEVSMRKRVYGRDVEAKKKTQAQANHKIAQMQAMVRLVVALQDPRTRLCLGCGTREEFFLGGDELGKWLADPETYVLASRRQRRTFVPSGQDATPVAAQANGLSAVGLHEATRPCGPDGPGAATQGAAP